MELLAEALITFDNLSCVETEELSMMYIGCYGYDECGCK